MLLSPLDVFVVALYAVLTVVVGLAFTRRAGRGTEEYFLSGRQLPWWLLGTSMVATTFSADTPNLVTDIVRTGGVSGNWVWWAFALTGLATVFFYAHLWRRSEALTDIEFYELRYSGRPAAFLRAFRALYLGVFFNVMIMATVTLAAMKIAGVLLGLDRLTTVLVAVALTVLYSTTSGLWGVVVTDGLLFALAMAGSLIAAHAALSHPDVGGLQGLITHPAVTDRLSLLPPLDDWRTVSTVLIVPLAVQWWSTWYPGAEPGGGGYIAQRLLAARNEREAIGSALWFNVAHYALRPWPWILVALASLVVYPSLDTIAARFPNLDPALIGHDLAYPAMLVYVPSGWLGLVVASLAAAYMSTMSTHLNWGASYLVNDVYRRFLAPEASERASVAVARISTIALSLLACVVALWLENALQAFQILLQIGAGTGLIFLLRWYWWRINAWSEITAMIVSFSVAVYFEVLHPFLGLAPIDPAIRLVAGVVVTTAAWLAATYLSPATDRRVLQAFYDRIRPFPGGWSAAVETTPGQPGQIAWGLVAWASGCLFIYSALFATAGVLYGRPGMAAGWGALVVASALTVFAAGKRMQDGVNATGASDRARHEDRRRAD